MKKFLLLTFTILTVSVITAQTWVQKNNFPGVERYAATGFEINGKLYMGTGYNGVTFMNDWWEYDPAVDQWTQKASFPGAGRYGASSFATNGKGYVFLGSTTTGVYTFPIDVWEYDPVNNQWTQKADFPGSGRYTAVSMDINGKGYVGTGWKQVSPAVLDDWWEYDPVSNVWTQKANFEGGVRRIAMGLSINDKGYVGLGADGSNFFNDLWEYNPQTNSWTHKADFIGQARGAGVTFELNNEGYFGSGASGSTFFTDIYKYNPFNNTWQTINGTIPGRTHPVSFASESCSYIVTGRAGTNPFTTPSTPQNTLNDFWDNCFLTNIHQSISSLNLDIYPNPWNTRIEINLLINKSSQVKIELIDLLGQIIEVIYDGEIKQNEKFSMEYKNPRLPGGIYLMNFQSPNFNRQIKLLKLN